MRPLTGIAKQRGIWDIEGLGKFGESAEKKPQPNNTSPNHDLEGARQACKPGFKRPIVRLGLVLAAVGVAILLWWVAYMFRYEVIAVTSTDFKYVSYIVKDRWTGQIEVVWQTAGGGKTFHSFHQPFELP